MQFHEPVNKFPDYVRCLVKRLQSLCPTLGKVKIAEILARGGLHLAVSTAGRMRKEQGGADPATLDKPTPGEPMAGEPGTEACRNNARPRANKPRVVTAKRPNHVWHVDLHDGAHRRPPLDQLAAVRHAAVLAVLLVACRGGRSLHVPHHGRHGLQAASHLRGGGRAFLGRVVRKAGVAPKYLICDQGPQFACGGFEFWCERKGIRPRYGRGPARQHRHRGTVDPDDQERMHAAALGPLSPREAHARACLLQRVVQRGASAHEFGWTNAARGLPPPAASQRRPALRAQGRWPRASPCATPCTLVKGQPGARLELEVTHYKGRKHLPLVTLLRAA